MMENYPHGLLAIPSDGYSGQRILVPVDEQKALIKRTHAEIHHQGHTKVHHVLYPLYYWPGMDATIEAVCTACARCIRATRRRRKLNFASTRCDTHAFALCTLHFFIGWIYPYFIKMVLG